MAHFPLSKEGNFQAAGGQLPSCRQLPLTCRTCAAGETYDELRPRGKVFQDEFASFGARAFGISGDRTQNL